MKILAILAVLLLVIFLAYVSRGMSKQSNGGFPEDTFEMVPNGHATALVFGVSFEISGLNPDDNLGNVSASARGPKDSDFKGTTTINISDTKIKLNNKGGFLKPITITMGEKSYGEVHVGDKVKIEMNDGVLIVEIYPKSEI